ncbi:YALI0A09262p [Yarrowia lipolytica CLIB122]|uniref:YALI0A09262p n=2 Tax=Yarrowia lipolytica TaxID=4952 RepID=F2Z604_YARLI|nr:YALI0A09262p [Yarrowia lipolytica CLIB122]QNP95553.1 Alkaline extracellular protease [Yarrowia lipolytica]RDW23357.1 putative extracellular protease [Yarrowia lipolytica]CAE02712.1 putative extracellular protease [Yarrowia lipolytica]CAG83823.1 YALI0A09262p [Yarrowia lipolytica CLIB122]SEI35767.1 YALIA101S08e02982g1_1 [Yarrowia lipolytica]|eukprot:XP_499896.1 YALI0A09262p [Yarrowia lipolytica CLIB122]
MKPSVILSLAVACLAAPMAPQGAYKDALDIINGQSSKFSDSSLRKRHGQEPDSFNIVFKDGVSIDQISEHLKLLDGLINKDSLNGIKTAFDLPSQKDGSGLMGYTGHFDKSIVDTLGNYSDLVTVEKDRIQKLPTFESFKSTQNVYQGTPDAYQGLIDNFFKWWRQGNSPVQDPNNGQGQQPEDDAVQPIGNQPNPIGQFPPPIGGENPFPSNQPSPSKPAPEDPVTAPSTAPSSAPSNGSSPGTGNFQEVPTKNWGLFRVSHKQNSQSQNQYAMNKDTKNPTVAYIVDSGIRTSHKMFEGRASWGANFADNQNVDNAGHGTHVAGTIGGAGYGVSPSTKLISVKVFANMYGSTSQIMQGVSWAIDDYVKNKDKYPRAVINFSGGGDTSEAEDALFRKAVEKGMVVAVAAGNDNTDACGISPGRAGSQTSGFITVAASSSDDSLAIWDPSQNKASNWGSCVDVIAPGTNILSADYQSDDGILSNSGTSMATPHVAGLAAQLMATSSELLTPAQVEDTLINANNGKITGNLNGTPNKLAYNGSGL